MWPTSVAMPVLVTRIVPAPRVTWVFMKARSTRSPSPALSATASTCFGTGTLSPVRADSSISRVAEVRMRASAGTRSPASMLTMSPGDELVHRQLDEGAVAADLGRDDHHLLERGDARVRLALLVQAHRGVEQRQADEHDAGGDLAGQEQAEHAGRQQDDLHRVAVLAQERLPARLLRRLGELVRAVLGSTRVCLGLRQSALERHALPLERGLWREGVPGHGFVRGCRWLVGHRVVPSRSSALRG